MNKTYRILITLFVLIYIGTLLYFSWIPAEIIEKGFIEPRGLSNHLLAFFLLPIVLALAFSCYIKRGIPLFSWLVSVMISIMGEAGQIFVVSRVYSLSTIFVNIAAINFPFVLIMILADIIPNEIKQ